jgi:hypothetical protein
MLGEIREILVQLLHTLLMRLYPLARESVAQLVTRQNVSLKFCKSWDIFSRKKRAG